MKRRSILCTLLAATLFGSLSAQTADTLDVNGAAPSKRYAKDTDRNLIRAALKGWHVSIGAGVAMGGAAPLPMPRSIRKIEGYDPLLNLSIAGMVHKRFDHSPFGLNIALRLENKGMKTRADVKNYHMEMTADDGGYMEGAWTGHVMTKYKATYLTVPITLTYDVSPRWILNTGPYFSLLLEGNFNGEAYDGYIRHHNPTGEKAYVSHATYDFGRKLRKFAWGWQIGGTFRAYKHLCVTANLDWNLNGLFPTDFESITFPLYPIYGNLGFAYQF